MKVNDMGFKEGDILLCTYSRKDGIVYNVGYFYQVIKLIMENWGFWIVVD